MFLAICFVVQLVALFMGLMLAEGAAWYAGQNSIVKDYPKDESDEALIILHWLVQRLHEANKPYYVRFLDKVTGLLNPKLKDDPFTEHPDDTC